MWDKNKQDMYLPNRSKNSGKNVGLCFSMELWSLVCLTPLIKATRIISKVHFLGWL